MPSAQDSIKVIKRFIRYLKKRMDIRKAEWDDFYNEELMCSFCARLENDWAEGGDHSFEMREIVRESTRYW